MDVQISSAVLRTSHQNCTENMSSKENNSEVAVDKATENDKAGGDAKSEVKGTKRPAESKSEDVKKQKKEENGEEDEDVEDEEDKRRKMMVKGRGKEMMMKTMHNETCVAET
uniref:Uncharacterized protein n=1 Tax=Timema shepardi TaxID=629360 RepID=A0A7R9G0N6_TIMSH|nr:unnamed protein product [Timema shepardi]